MRNVTPSDILTVNSRHLGRPDFEGQSEINPTTPSGDPYPTLRYTSVTEAMEGWWRRLSQPFYSVRQTRSNPVTLRLPRLGYRLPPTYLPYLAFSHNLKKKCASFLKIYGKLYNIAPIFV